MPLGQDNNTIKCFTRICIRICHQYTNMEKKRVYIVFFDGYDNRAFRDVFFTREAAEEYISKSRTPRLLDIEVFEETDNGKSKEIY